MSKKININIWGYDVGIVDDTVLEVIKEIAKLQNDKFNDMKFSGPFPLPTKIRKISISTSPHKHKESSGEQFEKRIHNRLIQITNFPENILDYFQNLPTSENVGKSIKIIGSSAT